jgi:hypothetical protein
MEFRQASFDELVKSGYRRVWLVARNNPGWTVSQFDELDRILKYPHVLIKEWVSGQQMFNSIRLYRVDLQ